MPVLLLSPWFEGRSFSLSSSPSCPTTNECELDSPPSGGAVAPSGAKFPNRFFGIDDKGVSGCPFSCVICPGPHAAVDVIDDDGENPDADAPKAPSRLQVHQN